MPDNASLMSHGHEMLFSKFPCVVFFLIFVFSALDYDN